MASKTCDQWTSEIGFTRRYASVATCNPSPSRQVTEEVYERRVVQHQSRLQTQAVVWATLGRIAMRRFRLFELTLGAVLVRSS
jgi:hypothetical protein